MTFARVSIFSLGWKFMPTNLSHPDVLSNGHCIFTNSITTKQI